MPISQITPRLCNVALGALFEQGIRILVSNLWCCILITIVLSCAMLSRERILPRILFPTETSDSTPAHTACIRQITALCSNRLLNSLDSALTNFCARNSRRICKYKFIELKAPQNQHLQKIPGATPLQCTRTSHFGTQPRWRFEQKRYRIRRYE